jgi:hypothetical protein
MMTQCLDIFRCNLATYCGLWKLVSFPGEFFRGSECPGLSKAGILLSVLRGGPVTPRFRD